MTDCDFAVSLRIRHPSIDPQDVTNALGFPPQHSWRAGDRREAQDDSPATTYRETYWFGPLPGIPAGLLPQLSVSREAIHLPLEGKLLFALAALRRAEGFLRRIVDDGGSLGLIIESFGPDAFRLDLSPSTIAMLARLGVEISLDVQPGLRAAA
jgi:hypothetical protein